MSGEVSQYPPTVYSFFTREFIAMAGSVIELLRACNAWVDPNLLALTKETEKAADGDDSKKSKRRRKKKDAPTKETIAKRAPSEGGDDDESDVDQFAFLGQSKLKRASHVSDAEDSDSDGDD